MRMRKLSLAHARNLDFRNKEREFDFLGGHAHAHEHTYLVLRMRKSMRPYTHEPDKHTNTFRAYSVEYSTNGLQRVDAQTSNWNWFRDRFKSEEEHLKMMKS
jgi:hypothetical protein